MSRHTDEYLKRLARDISEPTKVDVTATLLRIALQLWFAGGGLAFTTAFIVGRAFWPAALAFLKSWYFLYQYTHGGGV